MLKLIIKKSQQRLYFLRQLKKFGVGQSILIQFYRAVIESVLTFSITVWYGTCTATEKDGLNRIVSTASKIIGITLPSIESIFEKRTEKKVKSIIDDKDHPANSLFTPLPSGKRFRSIKARTSRFKDSFYVRAARHPVSL